MHAQLNCVQNLYFEFFIFRKITELCRFVTYLWDDPRSLFSGSASVKGVVDLTYNTFRSYGMLCFIVFANRPKSVQYLNVRSQLNELQLFNFAVSK